MDKLSLEDVKEIIGDDNKPAKTLVMGVGGSGINIINYFIKEKALSDISDFCVVNSDVQLLNISLAPVKIQVGKNLTKGYGTGGDVEKGRKGILECIDKIDNVLKDIDTLYIVTCLGGGMSTGGTVEIAKIAKELGIKTVCVVAKPFYFEGKTRTNRVDEGLKNLREIDNNVVIHLSNDDALTDSDKKEDMSKMFGKIHKSMADIINSINSILNVPALINIELGDISGAMKNADKCITGTGKALGKDRAKNAVLDALNKVKPTIKNSDSVIVSITGSPDINLSEVKVVAEEIVEETKDDAKVILGCNYDNKLEDIIKVVIIVGS